MPSGATKGNIGGFTKIEKARVPEPKGMYVKGGVVCRT